MKDKSSRNVLLHESIKDGLYHLIPPQNPLVHYVSSLAIVTPTDTSFSAHVSLLIVALSVHVSLLYSFYRWLYSIYLDLSIEI